MEDVAAAVEPFALSRDFYRNPYAAYAALRDRGPVHHVQFPDGSAGWLVTGYDAAKATFLDPTISKAIGSHGARSALAAHGGDQRLQIGVFSDMMVFYDPPAHTRLRAPANRAFGRALRDLPPRVTAIADALLDDVAEQNRAAHVDLLERFAVPLSMMVICELFGVPDADRDDFRAWSTLVVSGEHAVDERRAAVRDFVGYLGGLIAARAAEPGGDLLSEFLVGDADGDRLTDRELVSMVFMLLIAGFETSANLVGNAVAVLLRDDDARRELRADPDRIPAFIEEILRFRSPTSETTFRYTTAPTVLGGVAIPAGELVVVSVAATGRDPVRFAEPDRMRLDRTDNHHLAFGHGIHRCIGAPLARMEGVIALTRLLDRFPDIALAPGTTLVWRTSPIVRGLTALPVIPTGF